jgi:DNA polymerase-1
MKNLAYKILKTRKEVDDLISLLVRNGRFVVDLETTGLETFSPDLKIVGVGFSIQSFEAYYVPFNAPEWATELEGDPSTVLLDLFKPILEDPCLGKIGQNIKYDCRVFRKFGVRVQGIVFDTLLASYCLFSDKCKHSLDDMSMNHFGHIKIRTKSVIPKKKKKKGEAPSTMWDAPVDEVGIYCMEDVDFTFRLYEYFSILLVSKGYEKPRKIFEEIEMKLYPIIIDMECNGVQIDTVPISKIREELITTSTQLKKDICDAAGWEVTLTKPADIAKLIYDDLKIFEKRGIPIRYTRTKKRATTQKVLAIVADDPVVSKILTIKKMNKLLSTYVDGIPRQISKVTGKVHASFNQHSTSTGRLSSDSPNLQNIPQREEVGKRIRGAFVSSYPNGQILSADYSQQELRILAHLSGEPVLVETYKNNQDAHIRVASKIFGVPEDKVTKTQRDYCKTINYGLMYGMGEKKLSDELKITTDEAAQLMETYLGKMTNVAQYIKDTEKFLSKHGFTETMYGRRRYLPNVFSYMKFTKLEAFREGVNHTVQGSGADQVKMAMIKLDRFLSDSNKKSKLIMQVHDEIVIDVHPDELDITSTVSEIMSNVDQLSVPMLAEAKLGKSWKDAH